MFMGDYNKAINDAVKGNAHREVRVNAATMADLLESSAAPRWFREAVLADVLKQIKQQDKTGGE